MLGSDHAPHTLEEKAKPYPATPSGMPGVQTLVPVMLDHVNKGRLSLARFVDLTSAGPQRIFGIAGKGRIALGYDADLTVVDLGRERIIDNDWIGSKAGWTPFAGRKVKGWPVGTVVRGRLAMWEGELGKAAGRARPLRRSSSVKRNLLKEILPDPGRRDAEPVIAIFAAFLHRQRELRRDDAVQLDLLRPASISPDRSRRNRARHRSRLCPGRRAHSRSTAR